MIRPRPCPDLTDARLHRAQAYATRDGQIFLRNLCRIKRAELWRASTPWPEQPKHRRTR